MLINNDLKRRIIEISYKHSLSHLGSCLTAVDLIAETYAKRGSRDIFILSNGHAGLAQYVCLEKYMEQDAVALFNKHGVHPNYSPKEHIYASTGSLGHGIGIGVGYAMMDKSREVVIMVSDGEMAEGSVYESLNVAEDLKLDNLRVIVNANGYSALRRVYPHRLAQFTNTYRNINIRIYQTQNCFPFLEGLSAHYKAMGEEDYQLAMRMTK